MPKCNPATGSLRVYLDDFGVSYGCQCKYPHLVTQTHFGGDCDVAVGCEPHGRLDSMQRDPMVFGRCICDPGYVSESEPGFGPYCKPPITRREMVGCDAHYGYFSTEKGGCMNIFQEPRNTKFTERCHFKGSVPECYITFHDLRYNDLAKIFQDAIREKYPEYLTKKVDVEIKLKWPFTYGNISPKPTFNTFAVVGEKNGIVKHFSYDTKTTWGDAIKFAIPKIGNYLVIKPIIDSNLLDEKIPNCSSVIRLKGTNTADYSEMEKYVGYAVHDGVQVAIENDQYEWRNYYYSPYCIRNNEIYINTDMIADSNVNYLIPTTSIYTENGLQIPQKDERVLNIVPLGNDKPTNEISVAYANTNEAANYYLLDVEQFE